MYPGGHWHALWIRSYLEAHTLLLRWFISCMADDPDEISLPWNNALMWCYSYSIHNDVWLFVPCLIQWTIYEESKQENPNIFTYFFPIHPHPKTTPTKPMHGAIKKLYYVGSNLLKYTLCIKWLISYVNVCQDLD